jgi:DNA-binding XRE family transcriptional regulator
MNLNIQKLDVCMARECINTDMLADKAGLSRSTLYAFRTKKRNPSTKTVGKIAKALKVDVTEIIET